MKFNVIIIFVLIIIVITSCGTMRIKEPTEVNSTLLTGYIEIEIVNLSNNKIMNKFKDYNLILKKEDKNSFKYSHGINGYFFISNLNQDNYFLHRIEFENEQKKYKLNIMNGLYKLHKGKVNYIGHLTFTCSYDYSNKRLICRDIEIEYDAKDIYKVIKEINQSSKWLKTEFVSIFTEQILKSKKTELEL